MRSTPRRAATGAGLYASMQDIGYELRGRFLTGSWVNKAGPRRFTTQSASVTRHIRCMEASLLLL
jgi:hypothetical protein